MITPSSKYLYCVPKGGLNDSLNTIMRCIKYCKKYNRILLIETNKLSCFNDHFSNIFRFRNKINQKIITKISQELYKELNQLETYPNIVKGKIGNYKSKWLPGAGPNKTGAWGVRNEVLNFNLEKKYSEDLVVFEKGSGGELSFELVDYLVFSDGLLSKIKKMLKNLPEDYASIHIRNTDYKANDLNNFLKDTFNKIDSENVLICSDNYQTVKMVEKMFKNRNVIINKNIIDNKNKKLHAHQTFSNVELKIKKVQMEQQFFDLVSLAFANKLYACKVENPRNLDQKPFLSGFSKLALHLNKEKTKLYRMLNLNKKALF